MWSSAGGPSCRAPPSVSLRMLSSGIDTARANRRLSDSFERSPKRNLGCIETSVLAACPALRRWVPFGVGLGLPFTYLISRDHPKGEHHGYDATHNGPDTCVEVCVTGCCTSESGSHPSESEMSVKGSVASGRRMMAQLIQVRGWVSTSRRLADTIDPTPRLAAWRMGAHSMPHPVTVAGVYRCRNARSMLSAVREADAAGFDVRLWALDHESDVLARWTVGTGPGGRFELLNRALTPMRSGYVVLLDDDVTFVRGGLSTLVRLVDWFGLDMAQPAHARGSARSFPMMTVAPVSVIRETTFVEIGPVLAIAPSLVGEVTPFPENPPMGWGVDVQWSDLARKGRRFGIVDAVRVRHHGTIGSGYASGEESPDRSNLRDALHQRGAEKIIELQVVLNVHRLWSLLKLRR
jgi:hypothetical protein